MLAHVPQRSSRLEAERKIKTPHRVSGRGDDQERLSFPMEPILTSSTPLQKYVHTPNPGVRSRYRAWAAAEIERRTRPAPPIDPVEAEANRANMAAMITEIRRQDPHAFDGGRP